MRLARNLTIALILSIGIVLFLQAWLRVQRESAHLLGDAVDHHRVLGHALRAAIELETARSGEARARELVEAAERSDESVTVRWIRLDDPLRDAGTEFQDQLTPESLRAIERGEDVALTETVDGGAPRLHTYVPLSLPGDPFGSCLEISEALEKRQHYVRVTVLRNVAFTAAAFSLASLVAAVLGVVMVGRPMRALSEKARRMGSGDLSMPLRVMRKDEIGDLAREINLACDRLAAAHARLIDETAARVAAVEQLRHAERLATAGLLASGIAHEMGTPLNVVSERAKMIASREVEGEEALASARVIVDESARITETMRQLLDLTRRRTPQRAPEPVQRIVDAALALLRPLAQRQGVTLRSVPADSPCVAEIDGDQIEQALMNLMVNGMHAMGTGEIVVTVSSAAAPAGCRIDVEDRGPGIAPEDLARIFEPFFTTKPMGKGTGLGLSIAEDIVRQHGGRIEVASREGGGTRFSIHLPGGGPA